MDEFLVHLRKQKLDTRRKYQVERTREKEEGGKTEQRADWKKSLEPCGAKQIGRMAD